ncbi:MAG: polymorphic toxin-type HINT domain-containing protein [Planctomycetota bacterium]
MPFRWNQRNRQPRAFARPRPAKSSSTRQHAPRAAVFEPLETRVLLSASLSSADLVDRYAHRLDRAGTGLTEVFAPSLSPDAALTPSPSAIAGYPLMAKTAIPRGGRPIGDTSTTSTAVAAPIDASAASGTADADFLVATFAHGQLLGGAGDDTLAVLPATHTPGQTVTADAGAGDDLIYAMAGQAHVDGGPGHDVLFLGDAHATLQNVEEVWVRNPKDFTWTAADPADFEADPPLTADFSTTATASTYPAASTLGGTDSSSLDLSSDLAFATSSTGGGSGTAQSTAPPGVPAEDQPFGQSGDLNDDGWVDQADIDLLLHAVDQALPAATSSGNLGHGVAAQLQSTSDFGYILYSEQPVRDRFPHESFLNGQADHFLAVEFVQSVQSDPDQPGQWMYHNDNNPLAAFTPAPGDLLVIELDFLNDTAHSLRGVANVHEGIELGFASGSLYAQPNRWGNHNFESEFRLTGSSFVRNPQGLAGYAAAYDVFTDGDLDVNDANHLVHGLLSTKPGDANLDGVIDQADLNAVQNHWGQPVGWADGNFDLRFAGVGSEDQAYVLNNWGWRATDPVEIEGGKGPDILYGYAGDDTLDGGSGNDFLRGGAGADRLTDPDSTGTYLGGIGTDLSNQYLADFRDIGGTNWRDIPSLVASQLGDIDARILSDSLIDHNDFYRRMIEIKPRIAQIQPGEPPSYVSAQIADQLYHWDSHESTPHSIFQSVDAGRTHGYAIVAGDQSSVSVRGTNGQFNSTLTSGYNAQGVSGYLTLGSHTLAVGAAVDGPGIAGGSFTVPYLNVIYDSDSNLGGNPDISGRPNQFNLPDFTPQEALFARRRLSSSNGYIEAGYWDTFGATKRIFPHDYASLGEVERYPGVPMVLELSANWKNLPLNDFSEKVYVSYDSTYLVVTKDQFGDEILLPGLYGFDEIGFGPGEREIFFVHPAEPFAERLSTSPLDNNDAYDLDDIDAYHNGIHIDDHKTITFMVAGDTYLDTHGRDDQVVVLGRGTFAFHRFDLLADQNHDGVIDSLDLEASEGAISASNRGDFDQDGIIDFADNFDQHGLGTPESPTDSFEPLLLYATNTDGYDLYVRFSYPELKPDDISIIGNGSLENPLELSYAASGQDGPLGRLWMSDDTLRSHASVTDGSTPGSFIPANEWISADALFGGPVEQGDSLPIYYEAINPSLDVGDHEIRVEYRLHSEEHGFTPSHSTVNLTAFDIAVPLIDTQERQILASTSLRTSDSTPRLSNVVAGVSDVSVGANQSELKVDLHISGDIDDVLSNFISGSAGVIDSLSLFVNNSGEAAFSVDVDDAKSQAWSDLFNPYSYEGEFDGILPDLVVLPGWNTIEVVAVNALGHAASATKSFEIVVEAPSDELNEIALDLSAGSPYGDPTVTQIPFQHAQDGSNWSDPVWLQRDAGNPNRFTGDVFQSPVELILDESTWSTDEKVVEVSVGGTALDGTRIVLTENAVVPGRLEGEDLLEEWERETLEGYAVSIGEESNVTVSDPGELHPYLIEIVGPTELKDVIDEVALGENGQLREVVEIDGRLFIADPNELSRPSTFVLDKSLELDFAHAAAVAPPLFGGGGTFAEGLADGAVAPLVDLVETGAAVGQAIQWASENPLDAAAGTWKAVNGVRTAIGEFIGTAAVYAYEYSDEALAVAKKGVGLYMDTSQALAGLLADYAVDSDKTVDELIAGTSPFYEELPGEVARGIELSAEFFVELWGTISDLPDYDKGWYTGFAATTVASEVAITLLAPGVGNVASAISKSAFLSRVIPKFQAFGGKLAQAAGRLIGFADELATTQMCFIAGTPVHTADGLKPIEEIEAGDLVLSRDENTREQGLRKVVETFVTRPSRLYHVTYAVDGQDDQALTGTGEHPFYVHNRGAFVPSKELEVGDILCLSDNRPARVVRIETEDAPEGETFTTYNFEVEAFHTYFVGEHDAGVWVHNRGEGCEYIYSLVYRIQQKDGSEPWPAFKKVMDQSDFREEGIDLAEKKKRLARASRIDPHLHDAARAVMRDQYDLAVAADGTVDLAKVPRVGEIRELMIKRSERATHRDNFLNAHHAIVLNDPTGSKWWAVLGVPEEKLDDMPGVLLHIYEHQVGQGLSDRPSFHSVFKATYDDLLRQGINLRSEAGTEFLHEQAYSRWDPEFGPKIWAAAESWLDNDVRGL